VGSINGTTNLNAARTLLGHESVTPLQTADRQALMALWVTTLQFKPQFVQQLDGCKLVYLNPHTLGDMALLASGKCATIGPL
jgi:beta-xylosidase